MKNNDTSDEAKPEHKNSPERWLWIDPLRDERRAAHGAVLLAEDIRRYVVEFNLLVNKTDFSDGQTKGAKLKGASYTMTPHPTEAWKFERNSTGIIMETPLKKGINSEGEYYIVPKNSLVFIKLRQELRIPYYMIGRHNLKIRYVYKGLLLGTGPQVDPGYVGNLIIPLHNFTADDVFIYIESSFVSIDFVRTAPFFEDADAAPENIDELYAKYEKEKCLIEREKIEKRKSLSRYLEGSTPQSQMGKFEYDFGRLEQETKQELKRLEKTAQGIEASQKTFQQEFTRKWERSRTWKGFELLAVVGVLATILNLYRLQERDTEGRGIELQKTIVATNFFEYEQKQEKRDADIQALLQTNLNNVNARLNSFERTLINLTNNLSVGATNQLPGK